MTPLDEIEALLNGVAMADRRAFRKLYARSAPFFWAALRARQTPEAEEVLETGFVRIWEQGGTLRGEADGVLWMAQQIGLAGPQAKDVPGTVSVLEDLEKLSPLAPPEQILNRVETRLWGRLAQPVWRQVLPYALGAMAAALLAWIGMMTGVVTPI